MAGRWEEPSGRELRDLAGSDQAGPGLVAGQVRPGTVAWGIHNGTCALRVAPPGGSPRGENRLPAGGDLVGRHADAVKVRTAADDAAATDPERIRGFERP